MGKKINLTWLILTVFAISWIGVMPSLLIAHGIQIPAGLRSLEILMTLGPIIGAVLFILKVRGKEGLKKFFSRLLYFKASLFVIFLAVVVPILVSGISAVVGLKLSDHSWPEAFTASTIISNGLITFLMYLFLNTEELVWRGVVFDQLLEKYGFVKSCLLLAPVWWLFHIPLFLYPGGHLAGYGLIEFTIIVISQTFILGWIYVKSNRSLFYVHMHHQLLNGFGQAFPIFPVFIGGNKYPVWVFCLLLLLVAVYLVFMFPKTASPAPSSTHAKP